MTNTIPTLHTDLYQINMGEVYFRDGIHEKKAVFDVYFRKLPFGNGYAVFMGLERIIDYLNNFSFSEEDLRYLKEKGYKEDYLAYLSTLKFTGHVKSLREGEICFPNQPIVRIEADLIQAQLIETALLNIVNYQTLVATKASRIKGVAGSDAVMEFGTRRAQEVDASLWGARASYLAGFDATSNVEAGRKFGVPISGTHAHALVQVYRDEYIAFTKYAETHKDCVFLVDTYDTLKSGVPNAIRVAKEFGDRINFKGIRLDSGDLAYLSKEARKLLDAAGFTETKIVASNDLDEETIFHLKVQGARIDTWGVGTKNITCFDQPALGAVYKLACIEDENGDLVDSIKISSNPEKVSTPGKKEVYRLFDNESNHALVDIIGLEGENLEHTTKIEVFHPVHNYMRKTYTNYRVEKLLQDVFKNGKCVVDELTNDTIRTFHQETLNTFWEEVRRPHNPHTYYVDYSVACYENKMNAIQKALGGIK